MCGICGKVSLDIRENIDEGLIRRMTQILGYRGPDDEGIYLSKNPPDKARAGLGHRRLNIIDLSQQAHQPMPNEDKTIWIVYNGEIYNFPEIRKDLENKGHIFRSRSDTEVILHLYEDKGIDCVNYLRGMFAFAIWDENKERLLLARDRVGKKPLTYALNNSSLIFASEIKSILQDPAIKREVDRVSLDYYLTYQYVPSPKSMFAGINKLPAAHILVWEKGKVRIERYWSLDYKKKLTLKEDEICQRLLSLLREAVGLRLTSDVPLGAFLSGGVDSSAVVAIMNEVSCQPVKTFSIGFKEGSFNELRYARMVARAFKTEHHEYIVEPSALEVLPKLVWHFNEPFADSSAIPTYYLSKMTRQLVTVALNGDGGDECFGGYERYLSNKIADVYSKFPYAIRKGAASLFGRLPESTEKKDFIKRARKFINGIGFPKEARYAYWMSIFDKKLKDDLYSDELKYSLKGIDPWDYLYKAYSRAGTKDFLDATLFVDSTTYLPEDLLVKVDIASMANSLEARSPFLDHKLMEFAASIPSNLKLKGLTPKYILRKSLSKLLPGQILRRKKQGFGVPIGTWLKKDLKKYAYDMLLGRNSLKRGYFNAGAIKRLLDEHASARSDHSHRIFSLLNLELWHQMFID